jgi:PTH2 family peptidyl-tRNA hydrolase
MNKNPEKPKMVLVMRKDLNMRKGKMCAQAGHASMMFLFDGSNPDEETYNSTYDQHELHLSQTEREWFKTGTKKVTVGCDSDEELLALVAKAKELGVTVHVVTDLGFTEFHGKPTNTCAAFGPADSEQLDLITGHLKLL